MSLIVMEAPETVVTIFFLIAGQRPQELTLGPQENQCALHK
jgi:hypothetical protein